MGLEIILQNIERARAARRAHDLGTAGFVAETRRIAALIDLYIAVERGHNV